MAIDPIESPGLIFHEKADPLGPVMTVDTTSNYLRAECAMIGIVFSTKQHNASNGQLVSMKNR